LTEGTIPLLQKCSNLKKLILNHCDSSSPSPGARIAHIPEVQITIYAGNSDVLLAPQWVYAKHLALRNAGPAIQVPFSFPLTISIVSLVVSWGHATVEDWLLVLTAVPSLQALSVLGSLGSVGARLIALQPPNVVSGAYTDTSSQASIPPELPVPDLRFLRLQLRAPSFMRKRKGTEDAALSTLGVALKQRPHLLVDIVRPSMTVTIPEDACHSLAARYPKRLRVGTPVKDGDISHELTCLINSPVSEFQLSPAL
jgi:hypothetical protein